MEVKAAIIDSARALGFDCLKEKQVEAMAAFLNGSDTFVSLPTGFGKSVIYAALPGSFDLIRGTRGSIILCICPLTSLMMDQVSKFSSKGLKAEFVGDAQLDPAVKERVLQGEVQLLYITPESLITNSTYRQMLMSPPYKQHLKGLIVDEAHCVKTWGDNFRVAFSEIGTLRSLVPSSVNVMALTATATTETYHVVVQRLSMAETVLVAIPPFKDNISYHVKRKIDMEELSTHLSTELTQLGCKFPKTLVYVRTYTDCFTLYMALKKKLGKQFTAPPGYPNLTGYRVIDMFSRAMTVEKKEEVLRGFCVNEGKLRLVIATTAFGLGIDCPDIRQVIHWGIPETLEEYVQESGRSGRDGQPSRAVLYLGKRTNHATRKVLNYLSNTEKCRRRLLFEEFLLYHEKDIKTNGCQCCDICRNSCFCSNCVSVEDINCDL